MQAFMECCMLTADIRRNPLQRKCRFMKYRYLPLFLVLIAAPGFAQAYVGPGAGLSAIGAALALIGAVIFAILGFVWYPVKRLMRGRKAKAAAEETPVKKS